MEIDNPIQLSEVGKQALPKKQSIPEHGYEVEEIISNKPSFIVRWGITLLLGIILLLLAFTWFIRYPDIVEGVAVLTGNNAPKEIIPKQTGRLTALFVKTSDRVKQGQILGWIESNASTKEVIELQERLDSSIALLAISQPQSVAALFTKSLVNLGELQSAYQAYITSLLNYNDYLDNGFFSRRKRMLQRDIAALEGIGQKVSTQQKLTTEDNALAKKTFEMNKKLFEEKVISAEEYRQAQSTLLNKQKANPEMDVAILSQQNQIRDKQKEIDQLNHDILQQQKVFEQALHTLKSNVDDWLRKYTIQAPVDGQVEFVLPIQQHQHIEQGKLLGYVNPSDSKYYAEVKLSQYNLGKVDTGMKVQLRFTAYPYNEVGFVPGTLNYISKMVVDSGFIGTVRLDQGLLTNQNELLQYKPGLKAQALIITKDMRLLERFYYTIMKSVGK